ncbi:Uncharacterised protein [Streptococcus pneumoniae]|nr:Uncharacterised protein [Streptococcus pneumoniae]
MPRLEILNRSSKKKLEILIASAKNRIYSTQLPKTAFLCVPTVLLLFEYPVDLFHLPPSLK